MLTKLLFLTFMILIVEFNSAIIGKPATFDNLVTPLFHYFFQANTALVILEPTKSICDQVPVFATRTLNKYDAVVIG